MSYERDSTLDIIIPEIEDPNPAELKRRREIIERTLKLREEIGPLGFSLTDILRELREGTERE